MFKKLRSLIGKLFNENQQMIIVMYLSDFFWFLRKYFLSVTIEYPAEFLENWTKIKNNSSQDKERNFTVYQMIKVHNEIFKNKKTSIIEFGVDRGGTLTTICKFSKNDTEIFALDSFVNKSWSLVLGLTLISLTCIICCFFLFFLSSFFLSYISYKTIM